MHVSVLTFFFLLLTLNSCNSQHEKYDGSYPAPVEGKGLMSEIDNLPGEVLARQRSSGGLIPVEREWLFYSDGKIRHPNGQITRLEENDVKDLLSSCRTGFLVTVAAEYPPPPGSADYTTIELTIRSPEGIRTITAADTSSLVPEELWDFWDALQEAAKKSLVRSSH